MTKRSAIGRTVERSRAMGTALTSLIGIDAGTSVIKAVAFDLAGRQIASASVRNRYDDRRRRLGHSVAGPDLARIAPSRCAGSARRSTSLAARTAAHRRHRTGRRHLAGRRGRHAGRRCLAVARRARRADGRARWPPGRSNRARFEATGTGLNTCQQGAQMAHMDRYRARICSTGRRRRCTARTGSI